MASEPLRPTPEVDPAATVELRDVRRSFEGVRAVRGVSFALHGGEVVGLVGENGAGKSTIVRMLTGVTQPDGGTIWIRGQRRRLSSPRAARAAGIAAMYQEPLIFPDLDVAENVLIGRHASRWGVVDWKATRARAGQLVDQLGLDLDLRMLGRDLSVAQRQLVEIVKALSLGAETLILDEPTAVLSTREVAALLRIVRALRERGVALLYISHRLDEIMNLTDRIVVLRDGHKVAELQTAECSLGELIRHMVGRELSALIPARSKRPGTDAVLEVEGLTHRGFFHDVSFRLLRGEVLGFFGLVGAGRTELAQSLFGIDPIDTGTIRLEGHPFRPRSPRYAAGHGLAYAPENRLLHGLVAAMAIRLNVVMPIWNLLAWMGMVRDRRLRRTAAELGERVHLQRGRQSRPASTLSGGNQQKVVLAKWLASRPKVLILDEPTHGIDVAAKGDVLRSVDELAAAGVGVLLISSEIEEVRGICDRIVVMRHGTVAAEFATPVASDEVLAAAYGVAPPVEATR